MSPPLRCQLNITNKSSVYTYISVFAEVLNEGLPRASWLIIGDKSSRTFSQRTQLANTLIAVQSLLGLVMSFIFLGAANSFAKAFVPVEIRHQSINYVRISSFSALTSAVESAVAASTRAMDMPDVPLVLSSVKFIVNIVLDLLLISTFHVGSHNPTVNLQAGIQLICSIVAASAGLIYFFVVQTKSTPNGQRTYPTLNALRVLLRPGIWTLVESAVRNALYLWLITTIVSLGNTYATAWGVFVTMRWGLLMVPVFSLEAATLAFVGHNWGRWRRDVGPSNLSPKASLATLLSIIRPARDSVIIALAVEIPMCIIFSVFGARHFAYFLSQNEEVADVAANMWRTIDWCYIMFAVSTQIAAILLSTRPKWYLWGSLLSNIFYVLPWAIVCQTVDLDQNNAWMYHALVFGGSLVFSFILTPIIVSIWGWTLWQGKAKLEPFKQV